jgi:hypothetical protein
VTDGHHLQDLRQDLARADQEFHQLEEEKKVDSLEPINTTTPININCEVMINHNNSSNNLLLRNQHRRRWIVMTALFLGYLIVRLCHYSMAFYFFPGEAGTATRTVWAAITSRDDHILVVVVETRSSTLLGDTSISREKESLSSLHHTRQY